MKTIILSVKNIFNLLAISSVVIFGIIAAFLSGQIEYYVFKGLYSQINTGDKIQTLTYLPLVMVVVLEGSKFILHFVSSSIKNHKDCSDVAVKVMHVVNVVKWFLIILSFVCTLIFSANIFYYESTITEKNAQIQEINETYQNRLNSFKKDWEENNQKNLDTLLHDWEKAEEE